METILNTTPKMNETQKQLFVKLLGVLAEIVNETSQLPADDNTVITLLEEVDSKPKCDYCNNDQITSNKPIYPSVREGEGNRKKQVQYEARNVARLKRNHGQLTDQIRSSLNALGGGARTARALENMHKCISSAIEYCHIMDDMAYCICPYEFAEKLFACSHSGPEVRDAFQELELFNTNFFDALETMIKRFETFKVIAAKLYAEYGPRLFPVDEYLDGMFEPLTRDFESFIGALTDIAEKDIAALRRTQDFSSQRFLNLTAVAAFLSGVTASTLQITADDVGTRLAQATNSTWVISLVFSSASAVYSLLVMTWRQSSVAQPDKALPSFLLNWFRNGPMYALTAALVTFSFGLCLLSFRIGDQEGFRGFAVIPVAFAGVQACGIALFSAWFMFVKGRMPVGWVKAKGDLLVSACHKVGSVVKNHVRRVTEQLGNPLTTIRDRIVKQLSPSQCLGLREEDVELGEGAVEVDVLAKPTPSCATPNDLANSLVPPANSHPEVERDSVLEVPTPEVVLAAPGTVTESESEAEWRSSDQSVETRCKPFGKLLDFSPEHRLLAFARNDIVTIYKTGDSCSVLETVKVPNADEVKWICWSSRLKLLIRSQRSVFVWRMGMSIKQQRPSLRVLWPSEMLGCLNESVSSTQWTTEDNTGTEGFICTIGSIIKLYNAKCEEIPSRSIDVSELYTVDRVIDAAFVRKKCLLCLVDVPGDRKYSRLLVIDLKDNSIQSVHQVQIGHTSMTVSLPSNRVFLLGSMDGAEMADLSIPKSCENIDNAISNITPLWKQTYNGHKLKRLESAATFYGNEEQMLVGYSRGEIVVLHHEPDDRFFTAPHIFTTPTIEAMPRNIVSFAVKRGWSLPYMFAFADEDGRVMIWSVQSNKELDGYSSAKTFEVHDCRDGQYDIYGRSIQPTITTGKYLILPPPTSSSAEDLNE